MGAVWRRRDAVKGYTGFNPSTGTYQLEPQPPHLCDRGNLLPPLGAYTQQLVSVKGRAYLSQVDALAVPTAVMTTVRAHHPWAVVDKELSSRSLLSLSLEAVPL